MAIGRFVFTDFRRLYFDLGSTFRQNAESVSSYGLYGSATKESGQGDTAGFERGKLGSRHCKGTAEEDISELRTIYASQLLFSSVVSKIDRILE